MPSPAARRANPLLVLSVLAATTLIAACGGASAPTSAAPATPAASTGTGPGATAGVQPGGAASVVPVQGYSFAPEGSGIDVCAMLTDDEVEAATGHAVDTRVSMPTFGIFADGCELELELGGDAMATPLVSVGVMVPGGRAYYETHFAPYTEDFDQEPIEGLGDVAISGADDEVLVVKGDALVSVQFITGGFADDAAKTRAVAEAVLADLP